MYKILLASLMVLALSVQARAEINWFGIIVDYTSSKVVAVVVKSAGLSSPEAIVVSNVVKEVITEENINTVVNIAEGKKKAYRTDLTENEVDVSSLSCANDIQEFRNY